jgi:hypothetical protein
MQMKEKMCLTGLLLRMNHECITTTRSKACFNARVTTQERIPALQWELHEHLPYGPDLAPSNYHLFGLLKTHLGGKSFADDEEVETGVRKWLRQ